MTTPEEDGPETRADATDDAATPSSGASPAAGRIPLVGTLQPLSRRWAPVAVAAVALALGALLMAVWPANTPREASAAVAEPAAAIPAARPVSPPAPAPSGSPASSVSPAPSGSDSAPPGGSAAATTSPAASAPAAEGGIVTGLVENVDGLPNTVIATGDGPVHGDPTYGLLTYSVETDQSLAGELPELLRTVEATLGNTSQGWTAKTGQALQRVGSADAASIRIVLAQPALVDETCARVGLDTAGLYSCWDGAHTMLNSDRWHTATTEFTDLAVYRTYLVNHEFGHGLGFDHEYCPGPGEVAPVMQQQSISLQGCQPNGWPIP